ncbi:hypothetical protein F6455_13645 [Proteobacteria bacterium 005FR1]|nr:hypothetical protein [Proteobacteria bacterium 005FR1]
MTRAIHEEVPKSDKRTNRRLAFGVFAAPVAWLLHEIIGVSIIGRHCAAGAADLQPWAWIALVLLSAAAIVTAASAIITAWRVFRERFHGQSITRVEGWSRVQFVSIFGVFVSSFLLLNILYFSVLPFVVDPCVRTI